MKQKLKPCPFCGGTNIRRLRLHYDCLDCGGRNSFANWDNRPLEDAIKAKLAEAARLAESTRESVGKVVDGSEAARLRAMLAKVQAWREEMVPDGCNCSDGYAKRQLVDPGCQWHDIDVERLDAILNDAREGGEG